MATSRGIAISAYIPAFAKGAKVTRDNLSASVVANAQLSAKSVTSAKIRAAFLSGTLVSGQTTRAIAHGLGVKPKMVLVIPILTLAQGISAAVPSISLAAASAATSANFYVIGSQASNASLKYAAYVQL